MKNNLITFILALTTFTSCAVGPLYTQETARSLGKSKHEIMGGYGQAGYLVKWSYGLTDDLDLGVYLESLSFGLRAKYSFINNKDNWSLAAALGTGGSFSGTYNAVDIIGSYLNGPWEPYSSLRIVQVNNIPLDFNDKETGQLNFTVPGTTYTYSHLFLGTRYWFSPQWLLSVEASTLLPISSGLIIGGGVIWGASLGYRF